MKALNDHVNVVNVVNAVYIHIPFCKQICAYCDFCKVFYNEKIVDKYLDILSMEIKANYKGELITSLYIGGGTPSSLNIKELKKLFSILKIFNLSSCCEITFEANPDSLTLPKIELLKEFGVNRVSLGVETINNNLQKTLDRKTSKEQVITCINSLKKRNITNINVDLIYAIVNESLDDLKKDLDFLLSLDVPHISTYSLIIEDHTKLKINNIKNINTNLDRCMYDLIRDTLKSHNYEHYEISNFAKPNYYSSHNLKYWENSFYYGFGVGASGYLDKFRYTNTKSLTKYLDNNITKESETLTLKAEIEYQIMLNLRTKWGINKNTFLKRYNLEINRVYNYKKLVDLNILKEDDNFLYVNEDYFYVLDEIIIEFLDTLQTNVFDDIML